MERKNKERTMPTQLKYRPLPDNLQISCSPIDGMGIFAVKSINKGTNLGMTHIKVEQRLVRTPLGGVLNHSSSPNCEKANLRFSDDGCHYTFWNLITIEDIKPKEELTIKYEWYTPDERKR